MAAVQEPVTRADIEAKLRQIQGEVESTAESAKSYVLIAGIGGTVLLLLLAYILGRRKGRKKSTIVEVRRL
jgi:choline dehydrogenase-like flavoprotein